MAFNPDLPIRVYRMNSEGERDIVASFARYIEAEAFIHCELLESESKGTDAALFWGVDGMGRKTHYWIETSQVTKSVRNAI